MDNKYSSRSLAKCVAVSLGLSITAFSPMAQAVNWLNINSDWDTVSNGSVGTYPGTGGVLVADLPAVASGSKMNPNLDVRILINTLNINNAQADYDITRSFSTNVLTIASSIVTTGGGTTNIAPQIVITNVGADVVKISNTNNTNTRAAAGFVHPFRVRWSKDFTQQRLKLVNQTIR